MHHCQPLCLASLAKGEGRRFDSELVRKRTQHNFDHPSLQSLPYSRGERTTRRLRRQSILYHNLRKRAGIILASERQLCRGAARDLAIALRDFTLWIGGNTGVTAVGLLPDGDIQRQTAEKGHAVLLCHALAATGREDGFLVAAMRAHVRAHVLDDAE